MEKKNPKNLVIVGGGTAGWMSAAVLARHLKNQSCRIIVIDSSHVEGIGVGESVVPPVISFLEKNGFDIAEFMQRSEATFKLGTRFRNWLGKGEAYFHPFGSLGCDFQDNAFFDCWIKARLNGDKSSLMDYSPAAVMAEEGKIPISFKFPHRSPLSGAEYALHLDAGLAKQYLREQAMQYGVKQIQAHVVHVNTQENGQIGSLELNNRQTIEGDFFIDCSGFRGLLIEEILQSPFESWSHYLPCNRAVTVQVANDDEVLLYTDITANDCGWIWQVPLRDRTSYGYVFSSDHCSDEEATQLLLKNVPEKPLHEPHIIPLRTGMREQAWRKNCVALGLSAGFLEPLESTAIYLATRGIQHLLDLFPDFLDETGEWPGLSAEYNARIRTDFEEIRNFLILHYCVSNRADTAFWRDCQSNPVPKVLTERIDLFRARGEVSVPGNSLFKQSDWHAVLNGLGIEPRSYHPFVDIADFDEIHGAMQRQRIEIIKAVRSLPGH